jgi:hypothetical protein
VRANKDGSSTLLKLVAAAPDPQSDVAFLPQTRAVNLLKACQQWISSDEDIEEDLESIMTLVFTHAAPILQHIPGAHWDFMFDVVENNWEVSQGGRDYNFIFHQQIAELDVHRRRNLAHPCKNSALSDPD